MLLLLSPAKKLDYDSPLRTTLHTQPLFVEQAGRLIDILRKKSADEVADLMKLSQALATLNTERYAAWQPQFSQDNSRPAVLAFNGDVYEGLNASSLSDEQLLWAQEHVAILSGLYGLLRPLDLMQPYRLEMGTRLATPDGANLYDFWGSQLSVHINERLKGKKQPVVVNLASEEYFKAIDRKALKATIIQCVFQDYKNGAYKIISFYAKKARGSMARYVIENKIDAPEGLRGFNLDGYALASDESTPERLVFRRNQE